MSGEEEKEVVNEVVKVNWSLPGTERALLSAIEEVKRGCTIDGSTLSTSQWKTVVSRFGVETGYPWDIRVLQSKFSMLRTRWILWREYANKSGWSVSPEGQLLQEASVWEELLAKLDKEKTTPAEKQKLGMLRKLQHAPLPHYELMVCY
jgi:hypothetical protein